MQWIQHCAKMKRKQRHLPTTNPSELHNVARLRSKTLVRLCRQQVSEHLLSTQKKSKQYITVRPNKGSITYSIYTDLGDSTICTGPLRSKHLSSATCRQVSHSARPGASGWNFQKVPGRSLRATEQWTGCVPRPPDLCSSSALGIWRVYGIPASPPVGFMAGKELKASTSLVAVKLHSNHRCRSRGLSMCGWGRLAPVLAATSWGRPNLKQ